VAVLALAAFAFAADLGGGTALAVGAVAAVFAVQHVWVAQRGAAAALRAFDANLYVGALVLAGVLLDVAFLR
jgi:4-hydroxybenzoate polyprenyltransferase